MRWLDLIKKRDSARQSGNLTFRVNFIFYWYLHEKIIHRPSNRSLRFLVNVVVDGIWRTAHLSSKKAGNLILIFDQVNFSLNTFTVPKYCFARY